MTVDEALKYIISMGVVVAARHAAPASAIPAPSSFGLSFVRRPGARTRRPPLPEIDRAAVASLRAEFGRAAPAPLPAPP